MAFGLPSVSTLIGGPVGGFLWNNKGTIAAVIAVAALLLYIMSLKGDVAEWQTHAIASDGTIKELNAKLSSQENLFKTQNGSLQTLQGSVDKQNATINALNKQLRIKDEVIAQMKHQREQDAEKRRRELEVLLQEQEAKDCPSAIDFLIKGKGDLSW
jgi:chromosome segregation ATPase